MPEYSSYRPAVLNLWSADHWWSAAICLVVREQSLIFIFIYIKFGDLNNKQAKFIYLRISLIMQTYFSIQVLFQLPEAETLIIKRKKILLFDAQQEFDC